jgi:sugar transferase EpsL
MKEEYDIEGFLKPDNERLTGFGKILRVMKLDEIPNLINVLRGEISFVGPRPLPVTYTNLLSDEQKKRYNVKSGITGLSQCNKETNLSWNHRIKLDLIYTQNITFFGDLKILVCTLFFFSRQKVINEFEGKSIDTYKPNFND